MWGPGPHEGKGPQGLLGPRTRPTRSCCGGQVGNLAGLIYISAGVAEERQEGKREDSLTSEVVFCLAFPGTNVLCL